MTRYSTIVVDPPWKVTAGPLRGREGFLDANGSSRPLAYPSMSVGQIAALRVGDLAPPDAHLYLWTINRYLREAFDVVAAWGFRYSTTIVWAKNPIGGGLGGTYGIATEYLLFCRRGKLASLSRMKRNWFNWKRPYDARGKPKHSAKPDDFYNMIEMMSPGPYLEMFARAPRERWHVWGNECPSVSLPALQLDREAAQQSTTAAKPVEAQLKSNEVFRA